MLFCFLALDLNQAKLIEQPDYRKELEQHKNEQPSIENFLDLPPDNTDYRLPIDDSTQTNPVGKKAKLFFEILSATPTILSTKGGEDVILKLDPPANISEYCYCKFDEIIVAGHSLPDGSALCRSPPHQAGEAKLQFSQNRIKWYGDYTMVYVAKAGFSMWMLVLPCVVLFIVVMGFAFIKALEKNKRKKATKKRKTGKKSSRKNNVGSLIDDDVHLHRRNVQHV